MGVPFGPNAAIVERFEPSDDGSRLNYEITVTDPGTFTEPATLSKYWAWRAGEEIQNFDCADFDWDGE